MGKKEKGPAAVKQTGPRRKAEAKRLLKSKQKELESQESRLMLDFFATWTEPVSEQMAQFLWQFLKFLKEKDYHVIDERTVYCFPFSHLVRYKNLK